MAAGRSRGGRGLGPPGGPGQTRAGSSTSQGLHRGSSRSRPRRPLRSLHRLCFLLHHRRAASSTGATASVSSSGPRPSKRCTFYRARGRRHPNSFKNGREQNLGRHESGGLGSRTGWGEPFFCIATSLHGPSTRSRPPKMDAARRPLCGRRPPGKATLRHDPTRPALDAPEGKGIHMPSLIL